MKIKRKFMFTRVRYNKSKFPRNKVNTFKGYRLPMRRKIDSTYYYYNYNYTDRFFMKHLGEDWNKVCSSLIKRMKISKLSYNQINDILNDDYYIPDSNNCVIINPKYNYSKRHSYRYIGTKDQRQHNKSVIFRDFGKCRDEDYNLLDKWKKIGWVFYADKKHDVYVSDSPFETNEYILANYMLGINKDLYHRHVEGLKDYGLGKFYLFFKYE